MKELGLIAIGAALLCAPTARAQDETCSRIEAFHAASLAGAGEGDPVRWAEMRWEGRWLDFDNGFGLRCVSSGDDASTNLCDWLVQNTSFEFPTNLPMRVLECFGYVFPRPWGEWRDWRTEISLERDERSFLVQIDLMDLTSPPVVRLVSFAEGRFPGDIELPALKSIEP